MISSAAVTTADIGVRPLRLSEDGQTLHMLDQRKLPGDEVWLDYNEVEPLARAIEDLVVRGAPAIGISAAFGIALG